MFNNHSIHPRGTIRKNNHNNKKTGTIGTTTLLMRNHAIEKYQLTGISTIFTHKVAPTSGKNNQTIVLEVNEERQRGKITENRLLTTTIPNTAEKLNKNHKSNRNNKGFQSNIPHAVICKTVRIGTILHDHVAMSQSIHIHIALMTLLSAPHSSP